ncbi:MAG: glycosyltransferase family 2 protein [Deltaproteobacteria bacterium]|nr:glycosyltransferase family 2 protein [Deltaproteobacteria bacterium]
MPTAAKRATISIVSPCFNEAEVVPLFYDALIAVLAAVPDYGFEIVLVDDGSADATLSVLNTIAAKDPRVRVASLSRNFGHQMALTAGIDLASGDAVIVMDCDLQHPPTLIPELIVQWRAGNDIVSAVRKDTTGASLFKKISSRAFYWLINAFGSVHIPNGVADFGLLSRRAANELRRMREHHRFLRGMISWSGFSRSLVPYKADARAAGRSKYTLFKMIGLALDAVISFSTVPLRLATRVGFSVTVAAFAYLTWNMVNAVRTGNFAPGWASLIAVTMLMGGSQLIFVGILGQYVARMFEELKDRPLYILKQDPRVTSASAETLPPPS